MENTVDGCITLGTLPRIGRTTLTWTKLEILVTENRFDEDLFVTLPSAQRNLEIVKGGYLLRAGGFTPQYRMKARRSARPRDWFLRATLGSARPRGPSARLGMEPASIPVSDPQPRGPATCFVFSIMAPVHITAIAEASSPPSQALVCSPVSASSHVRLSGHWQRVPARACSRQAATSHVPSLPAWPPQVVQLRVQAWPV